MKTALQQFLEEFNQAFARSDIEFLKDHVTDNIRWNIVGDHQVDGKEAFLETLRMMVQEQTMELTIHKIITHGKSAAVNGEIKSPDGKTYAFCDIYSLNGFKNPKISEMTSYAFDISS